MLMRQWTIASISFGSIGALSWTTALQDSANDNADCGARHAALACQEFCRGCPAECSAPALNKPSDLLTQC